MRGKYEAKILNGGVEEGTNEENSRGFLPKDAARMTAEEEEKYAKRQNTEGRMLKRRERKMPSINRGAETEKRRGKAGEGHQRRMWFGTKHKTLVLHRVQNRNKGNFPGRSRSKEFF